MTRTAAISCSRTCKNVNPEQRGVFSKKGSSFFIKLLKKEENNEKKHLTKQFWYGIIICRLKMAFLSVPEKGTAISSASLREREVLFVFAVIETGGKQYKVIEQDIIFVEKLDVNEGDEIVFDSVLALSNESGFKAGAPTVAGAKVTAKVLKNGKN